ncbi:hypothetical protein [Streptomyces sp. 7N604]|uniref:hypothetical protein n=1 Tax=Streptomyces sp. 7N604 TaxID=3457415 RepID=UPI003FD6483E
MFSVLRVALGVMVLAGLLVSLTGSVASAHVPTTDGTSTIRQDGALVRYQLELDYDTLTKAAGLGTLARGAKDAEREAFSRLTAHSLRPTWPTA